MRGIIAAAQVAVVVGLKPVQLGRQRSTALGDVSPTGLASDVNNLYRSKRRRYTKLSSHPLGRWLAGERALRMLTAA